MKRIFITILLAISTFASSYAGVLDDWGRAALVKEYFMEYAIKFRQENGHIRSITLNRKGKDSGNAWFHGGECYALMVAIARGPGSRVNFGKDVFVPSDGIWIDKVTGNRMTGDEKETVWRFKVENKSGTPILTGVLEDADQFVITEVN